jgi:leader peptidase (prepilin peptidase)/N-methyltransferase
LSDFIQLLESSTTFFYSVVFILSTMVGSFLNVVIYRLPKIMNQSWRQECREFLGDELKKPKKESEVRVTLSKPDSTCPNCQHKIRSYENIPVFSWLFLRGKCSSCKNPISARYPLVELSTGLLGLCVGYMFGFSMFTCFALILTWSLVALTMIDIDHMLLPDQITLPLLWLGLCASITTGSIPLEDAVVGAIAGYGSLYAIFWAFKLATGKDGMGYGDFKLFALLGAWVGWELLPLLAMIAGVLCVLFASVQMLLKKHTKDQPMPFGPYLAIAGWITLLWGNSMWSWYLIQVM